MITPEEVCDRVFGAWTRDTPVPNWMVNYSAMPWRLMFPGDPPEWWVEPVLNPYQQMLIESARQQELQMRAFAARRESEHEGAWVA